MKAIHQTITHWQAVDGKLFDTQEACGAHEAKMSPAQRYVYEKALTKEKLAEEGLWEYGYVSSHTTTYYEDPGFLREGGEYDHVEHTFVSLGFAQGRLDQVLMVAAKNAQWARSKDRDVHKRAVVKA